MPEDKDILLSPSSLGYTEANSGQNKSIYRKYKEIEQFQDFKWP